MHEPVLLREAVAALVRRRDGRYVDGTFGRGGHSRAILAALGDDGRLLALDRDPQARAAAARLRERDGRFDFRHGSFAELPRWLRRRGIGEVDGILLDLGVSSPQLEQAERGFSFARDGPLDMRMDTSRGVTAAQWLATVEHAELAKVLRDYGEERHAGRLASAILRERDERGIHTTGQFAAVVAGASPARGRRGHPATRAFQAIRIYINGELDELAEFLAGCVGLLGVGGRLVIISFHSLEDRLVKRFLRERARGSPPPRGVPVREAEIRRELRLVGAPVRASAREVRRNPRSRSAVMRVAERRRVH